jgi:hypothetical protein
MFQFKKKNLQQANLDYSYTPAPPHILLRPAIMAERSRGGLVKGQRLSKRSVVGEESGGRGERWERREPNWASRSNGLSDLVDGILARKYSRKELRV